MYGLWNHKHSIQDKRAYFISHNNTQNSSEHKVRYDTYLDKLLDGLCDISVELFDLYSSQVHVAEQTVDDLEERLLHAGKALIQQLRDEERHEACNHKVYLS